VRWLKCVLLQRRYHTCHTCQVLIAPLPRVEVADLWIVTTRALAGTNGGGDSCAGFLALPTTHIVRVLCASIWLPRFSYHRTGNPLPVHRLSRASCQAFLVPDGIPLSFSPVHRPLDLGCQHGKNRLHGLRFPLGEHRAPITRRITDTRLHDSPRHLSDNLCGPLPRLARVSHRYPSALPTANSTMGLFVDTSPCTTASTHTLSQTYTTRSISPSIRIPRHLSQRP